MTDALPAQGKYAASRSSRRDRGIAWVTANATRPHTAVRSVFLLGVLGTVLAGPLAHGGDRNDDRGVVTADVPDAPGEGDGSVPGGETAVATHPMPLGPARPAMLLLDSAGPRQLPAGDDLDAARRVFRVQCRDLMRVSRTHAGARMAAALLEEAAVTEKDPCLKWVLLEESIRLGSASGEPQRIESAVELAAEYFRIDAVRTELDALDDIPLRALDPVRASAVAEAAERIATSPAAEGRPRDRSAEWVLAADAWKRAGNTPRATAARAAARRASTAKVTPGQG